MRPRPGRLHAARLSQPSLPQEVAGPPARTAAPRREPVTKVVRVIARMNVGGPARHCLILGQGLRAHGFETTLLTGDLDDGEAELHAARNGGPDGLPIVRIPGLGRQIAPHQDLRALAHLVRAIRRERPDIVHTHTAKAGALGRLAARLAGVPVVVHTFHGHVLTEYFAPATSRLVRLAEQGLTRITERIVTLSPALRDELADRYRVAPRERISVIPLGQDLEAFRQGAPGAIRRELDLPDGAVVIGGVGRMVPIKRFPLLVRAFARVAARNPLAHLVLVGDGTERAAVEEQVGALGLGARVHLLGWREDLPTIYADLDVVALSSRNEGTPLAIVESFAAGMPVVSTAVGGVPDMFSPAEPTTAAAAPPGVDLRPEGALVGRDDEAALAAALEHLAARPDLRQRMGERALARSETFGHERLVADVAALYRELLAERAGR